MQQNVTYPSRGKKKHTHTKQLCLVKGLTERATVLVMQVEMLHKNTSADRKTVSQLRDLLCRACRELSGCSSTHDVTALARCLEANTHQVHHQRGLWGAPGLGGNVPSQSDEVRVGRYVLDKPQAEYGQNDDSNQNKKLLFMSEKKVLYQCHEYKYIFSHLLPFFNICFNKKLLINLCGRAMQ